MIRQKVDVVLEQAREPLFHPARHAAVLPAPEQSVMHQNGVGLLGHGGFDQGQTGGDTCDELAHLKAPFDLQTIGSIVTEQRRLQQGVQPLQQLLTGHRGRGGDRDGHGLTGGVRALNGRRLLVPQDAV